PAVPKGMAGFLRSGRKPASRRHAPAGIVALPLGPAVFVFVAADPVGSDAVAGFKVSHVDEIGQKLFAVGLSLLAKLAQDALRKLQVFHFARLVHRCPQCLRGSLADYTCTKVVGSLAARLRPVAPALDQ
ncbi:hypothetical protein, partial [Mesorhizobium sp.]|uniref:hypothetical protein n=1 Tax=Mesorhizobium sp. TaxID=1871066 RepID=UPI0025F266D4